MRTILIIVMALLTMAAAEGRGRTTPAKVDGNKHSAQNCLNFMTQSLYDSLETNVVLVDSGDVWSSRMIALQEELYGYPSIMDLLVDLNAGSYFWGWFEKQDSAYFDSVEQNNPAYTRYSAAEPFDTLGQRAHQVPFHMADSLWFWIEAVEDCTKFNAGYSSARP
ncbi:hypothetical protein KKC97_03545 [bacterium]|nr:hypothetical protein [bacterium]MBU1636720.1 hypothetical protein [bacterium]MBU1919783.1 hypothetical protein [bacterium]